MHNFDYRLDVYVTVELVLLKPDKQATPVQHPDNPISLCTLDSLHLEKEGRCEVKRMELTPHTCEIKEETPILLKRVGEVPPSMPPTTIQVARNTVNTAPPDWKSFPCKFYAILNSKWTNIHYMSIKTSTFGQKCLERKKTCQLLFPSPPPRLQPQQTPPPPRLQPHSDFPPPPPPHTQEEINKFRR